MGIKTSVEAAGRDSREAARIYLGLGLGLGPIPIPRGKKAPALPGWPGWPEMRLTEEDLPRYFTDGENIGLLLGEASKGLVDVDLDCAEAVAVAERILPPTLMSGRERSPKSHYWYLAQPTPKYRKFSDLDGGTILEIRGAGHQTVVPPSRHPEGDLYRWENNVDFTRLDGSDIEQFAKETATAALLRRYWGKDGRNRHDLALAAAGFLARRLSRDRVLRLIAAAAGDDEEVKDRLRAAEDSLNRLEAGQPVTGAPALDQLVTGLGQRLSEWWGQSPQEAPLIAPISLLSQSRQLPWPADLAPEAFHGLAGRVVRAMEPHTEADPAALLMNFLVSAGAVFGDRPSLNMGGIWQPPRLFGIVVGKSSKARKGTSWSVISDFLVGALKEIKDLMVSGLSSGEGLIWEVRDAIFKREPIKEKGRVVGYQDIEADPGVSDKRRIVLESEFARTLKVMGRETNILSSVIRQAWDSGALRVMTKHTPAKATAAHVCILGHITSEELLRTLDSTESANGFANRFLWMLVKRSKCLPEGGQCLDSELAPLREEFRQAVEFARATSDVKLNEDARTIWREVYPKLSDDKPGLFGAVTGRAEAQVLRLSLIYALLDRSSSVKPEHLMAALAFWERVEASVRYIFGDRTGDPVADAVVNALRSSGAMTQADISNLFGRHQSAERIGRALAMLQQAGRIRAERRETGGRPATLWRLVEEATAAK